MRERSSVAISAAGIVLAGAALAVAETRTTTPPKTGYAPVNGLSLYYEIHGGGEPLILLHGGVGATGMFDEILPLLSNTRRVIAVDLQAHGRTADIDRPLSLEAMADDIAALMKHLGIGVSNARLAILPGLTHYNIFSSPALASTVTPFLDSPMPGTR